MAPFNVENVVSEPEEYHAADGEKCSQAFDVLKHNSSVKFEFLKRIFQRI